MTDNTGEPLTGTKNGRSTDITIASLTDQQKRRMVDINTGEPSTGTPKRRRTDITEEPSAGSQTDKISDNTKEPLTGTEKEKMGHTCSTSEDIRYNLSDNCHNYAQVNIILTPKTKKNNNPGFPLTYPLSTLIFSIYPFLLPYMG